MKKNYFSPELEEIKLDAILLSSTSPDSDTTDPVNIDKDPDAGDFDW